MEESLCSCMKESRGEIGSENNWILSLESNRIFCLLIREVNFVLYYRCPTQYVLSNMFATRKTFTLGL